MLKIEDLKVGDEFECIDLWSIKNRKDHARSWVNYICENRPLVVSSIDSCNNLVGFADGQFYVEKVYLKYFKKKEQSQYTFVKLQNLAHKAVIDGVLEYYHVEFYGAISFIKLAFDGKFTHYNSNDAKSGVDFIKSLYKETFVIECADDIKRIKKNAMIKLENENEVCAESDCINHGVNFISTTYGGCNFNLSFISLKGAKVEQSKG